MGYSYCLLAKIQLRQIEAAYILAQYFKDNCVEVYTKNRDNGGQDLVLRHATGCYFVQSQDGFHLAAEICFMKRNEACQPDAILRDVNTFKAAIKQEFNLDMLPGGIARQVWLQYSEANTPWAELLNDETKCCAN